MGDNEWTENRQLRTLGHARLNLRTNSMNLTEKSKDNAITMAACFRILMLPQQANMPTQMIRSLIRRKNGSGESLRTSGWTRTSGHGLKYGRSVPQRREDGVSSAGQVTKTLSGT